MDALDQHLAARRALAAEHLIAAGKYPRCPRCGQEAGDDGWMTARDYKDDVFSSPEWKAGEHATIGLALYDLLDQGVFERRADQKIRLVPENDGKAA